jgi:hypothetical protein
MEASMLSRWLVLAATVITSYIACVVALLTLESAWLWLAERITRPSDHSTANRNADQR